MTANVTALPAPPTAGQGRRALSSDFGRVLAMWVAIRTAMLLWMIGTAWLSGVDPGRRLSDPLAWVLGRLVAWDSIHFIGIAQHGYNSTAATCCEQAFFPGYPLSIRVLTPLFGDARIAALFIPVVAGRCSSHWPWLRGIPLSISGGGGQEPLRRPLLSYGSTGSSWQSRSR